MIDLRGTYAEQGLLVPAHVDPVTGYRYYAAEQAGRARLSQGCGNWACRSPESPA